MLEQYVQPKRNECGRVQRESGAASLAFIVPEQTQLLHRGRASHVLVALLLALTIPRWVSAVGPTARYECTSVEPYKWETAAVTGVGLPFLIHLTTRAKHRRVVPFTPTPLSNLAALAVNHHG